MLRLTAGQTVTRAFTAPGSGSLTGETFTAYALDQAGRRLTATAEITNAATREVTINIASDEWAAGNGGFGRLEATMLDGGVKSAVHVERVRIMPSLSVTRTMGYSYA